MVFSESDVYVSYFPPTVCQLGNSGNSAISVKGKALTNVNIYEEGKIFLKSKI